ncbi:MAG TPA: PPC domain-containing DNA-binding protein [Candidatus Saccharimonadia bacterium]
MQHYPSPALDLVVLVKGEHLFECLERYAASVKYPSAWLSGIGAASSATIGAYDPAIKGYHWETFKEPLEILSLQGNLSWVDGKPFWHIHGSFAGHNYQSIGGHIKALEISVTAELTITPHPTSLTRTFDEETGIKLLRKQ